MSTASLRVAWALCMVVSLGSWLLSQELAADPLGILRPSSKLQHTLPLASAYSALKDAALQRPGDQAVVRQRRRIDDQHLEPKCAHCYSCLVCLWWGKHVLSSSNDLVALSLPHSAWYLFLSCSLVRRSFNAVNGFIACRRVHIACMLIK